jgi:hypothetical protein
VKNNARQTLQKELREVGAEAIEIDELVLVATRLELLRMTSKRRKARTYVRRVFNPVLFGVSGFAVGIFLVVASQAALPTNPLYSVQKFSDSVVVRLYPQYKVDVMMKLAQQVNELVSSHADSKVVLATLADYMEKASVYKSAPHSNYAALEYCKTSLQQASSAASPVIRRAIATGIQSLEST